MRAHPAIHRPRHLQVPERRPVHGPPVGAMPHRQNTAGSKVSILQDDPELLVHAAGETTFPKAAVRRAYRGKKFVHFEREGSCQAINRREPDFLFPTGFDLLEEVLGEVSHLRQLLLRQAMAKPELFQTKPNSIQGSHTSDRRDNDLTLLPVFAWIFLNQISHQSPAVGRDAIPPFL